MLSTLVGAALDQLHIYPLAGHLFIFFLGTTGLMTPPFCPAAYAAAPIAKADPFKIGWAATKFGISAFMSPFLFLFHHGLLFKGTPAEIISDSVVATIVIFLMACGLSRYFLIRPMNRVEQILTIGIPTIFCLIQGFQSQYVYWIGAAVMAVLLIYLIMRSYAFAQPRRAIP